MSRIVPAGFWRFVWGPWHLIWAGVIVWGAQWVLWFGGDARTIRLIFAVLYTLFVPLEALGVIDEANDPKDDGIEIAKTKSHWVQLIAQMGKAHTPLWWGPKALAASFGLADALIVGWIVWPLYPALAIALGSGLALYLMPHYGDRATVG